MGVLSWIGLALGIIFMITFIFSCCKISSRADRMDEEMFQRWLKEHNEKDDK